MDESEGIEGASENTFSDIFIYTCATFAGGMGIKL
jgi:hypothetical protein